MRSSYFIASGTMENKHEQRNHVREYTRHPISVATDIRVEKSEVVVHALMRDINIKGAGFLSKTELAKGTSVQFSFEGIRLTGKVVRVCEAQQDHNLFDIGVAFGGLGYFQTSSLKKTVSLIRDGKYEFRNGPATETLKESIFNTRKHWG